MQQQQTALHSKCVPAVDAPLLMFSRPIHHHRDDLDEEVLAEIRQYCAQHPRSPAAARRPRVMRRGNTFVALLGSSMDDGIAGLGGSVEAALQAFDVQYLSALRPPRG
jgi:hypothetical protein